MVALIGACIAAAWVHWMRNLGQAALDKHGKIEAALRESEQKYRLLFETMVEGISIDRAIFDSHGQVVDWIVMDVNPAYERILQISRDEVTGQRASQIYQPRGIPLLLSEFGEALKTGRPVSAHLRLDRRKLDVTITSIDSDRVTVILGDVTDRDRSMEAEREQRRLAEALRDISGALTSTLELEEVLDRILVHLRQIADYDAVNMMLIEQGRGRIVLYHGYRERGLDEYIRSFSMPVDEVHGLRWMAEHRKPLVISNTEKDGSWMVFPPTAWIQSYVGIPIFSRDELIGFLNLNSATPDFFQVAQIDRLQPFANQAALAIANARVFEDTQKRAQRLALINRVASTLNQPLELKTVLQVTADCLAEALNVPQVAVALFDETRKHLPIVADHPAPGNSSLVGTDLPVEDNPSMDYILREKTSLLVEDAQQDNQLMALRSIMVQRGISSIVIIPLIIRGEVAGTIGCDLIEPGRRYTTEEIELAETITNMAAVRIEQARLFAEEHRRSSELALLHITSLDITMTNDLPKLLQTVVERAAWLMDAQGGSLYLTNNEERVLERRVSFNLHYDIPDERMNFGQG
ncbi:MAG: GAF domain-containing protein, partial [Chloroflexi bacterium]